MSTATFDTVLQEVNDLHKQILLVLMSYTDADGDGLILISTLAQRCNCSVEEASDELDFLTVCGYITHIPGEHAWMPISFHMNLGDL